MIGRVVSTVAVGFVLIAANVTPDDTEPLRIATAGVTTNLDPHEADRSSAILMSALYEGLLRRDPRTLLPVPAIASSWELSEDGHTYTFFLRTEARFATGEPILAHDIRESWLRLISPAANSRHGFLLDAVTGAIEYRTGRSRDTSAIGIVARAPRILEVELRIDEQRFLTYLTHPSLAAVHQRRRVDAERLEGGSSTAIGNGPYRIVSNGEPLRLVRSETYWDKGSVQIEHVEVFTRLNPKETSLRYNRGVLDWVTAEFSVSHLSRIESIRVNPLFATTYLYFSTDDYPWTEEEIRRILVRVVPGDELRPRNRYLPAADTLVPDTIHYPTVNGLESVSDRSSIARLSATLDDDLPQILVRIPETQENRRIAEVVQYAWQTHLALDVTIEGNPNAPVQRLDIDTVSREERSGDTGSEMAPTIVLETSIAEFVDPTIFLERWRSDSSRNPSGFRDLRFDRLLEVAQNLSGAARMRVLADAEQLLLDSAIIIPVSRVAAIHLIDTEEISGWSPNLLDYHPISSLVRVPFKPPPGVAGEPLVPPMTEAPQAPGRQLPRQIPTSVASHSAR